MKRKYTYLICMAILVIPILIYFGISNKTSKEAVPASVPDPFRVDGTTGVPIGGVGTGAVKYCAWTGILNAFTDMTPAGMQVYNKHVTLGNDACFQFYSNRNGTKVTKDTLKVPLINGRYDDDAIFPIHKANYGVMNNVEVRMTGFCPWDLTNFSNMCLPCAFYEFTLTNTQNTPVDVAVALKIKYEANPVFLPGKGLNDQSSIHKKAVYAKSSDESSVISAGNDTGFLDCGKYNNLINEATNKLAVKVLVGAKETKTIKFVLAWYKNNTYGKYYYENLYAEAGSIADAGLTNFDTFKNNAVSFVERMRSSNVPMWMNNYLLNVLCNMVNNTVYTKDGRACLAEGEFDNLGTIDEYWQGRATIGSNMMPEFTWNELEFWARTQFRGTNSGQIHHDFAVNKHGISDEDLCGWDDYSHPDYRSLDDVVSWPDENVGFIVGIYETFIATDDHEKLGFLWPYLKNTAKRLLTQKDTYGDPNYPWTFETSHNMYDAGGYCQTYSTGTVIPAYKCMALLAEAMNDPDTKKIYEEAASQTIKGFEAKYLATRYKYLDKHCEGALAGPWFSQCLKFDQFNQGKVDQYIYNVLDEFYTPRKDSMGYPEGTYNEWPQHIVGHLGGYALQRNRFDVALSLWKDMYNRSYQDRNRIFNLPISLQAKALPKQAATDVDGYLMYSSRTSTWRMYQDIIGYYRNKHTGEIWLEPIILPEMDHRLTNGFFISAEGYGTVSCAEKGSSFENRTIFFKPDNSIYVNGIYIKDHSGSPVITVNGARQTWTKTGPTWKQRILINWSGKVNEKGIVIDVEQ